MLDKLRSLLKGGDNALNMAELRHSEPLAVCAVLLEVAEADFEVAPEELEIITALLVDRYHLGHDEVSKLIAETHAARAAEPDLWSFTTSLARRYGPDEKLKILEMVWQVILADGRLDPYEDQLAARLRGLLAVNHSVLMDAKQRARQAIDAAAE